MSILTKHALFLVGDILDYIEHTDETGILLSLDQEKAFDRVDRTFLQNLLICFGFGPSFCHWIYTFYNGANMRVIVNKWLTEPIPLMLYIICVESLASKICAWPEIEGFNPA